MKRLPAIRVLLVCPGPSLQKLLCCLDIAIGRRNVELGKEQKVQVKTAIQYSGDGRRSLELGDQIPFPTQFIGRLVSGWERAAQRDLYFCCLETHSCLITWLFQLNPHQQDQHNVRQSQ